MEEQKQVKATIKNLGKAPRIFFDIHNNPFEVPPGRTVEQMVPQSLVDRLEEMCENGDKLEVNGKVSDAVKEEQEAEMDEANLAQERAAKLREQQDAIAAEAEEQKSVKSRSGRRAARPGARGGRHVNKKDE